MDQQKPSLNYHYARNVPGFRRDQWSATLIFAAVIVASAILLEICAIAVPIVLMLKGVKPHYP